MYCRSAGFLAVCTVDRGTKKVQALWPMLGFWAACTDAQTKMNLGMRPMKDCQMFDISQAELKIQGCS